MPANSSFLLRRIGGALIILTIAGVFLFSAWSKLTGISSFEWTFIQLLHVSGKMAAVIARVAIGLEALLGLFLLAHLFLKSFTYKALLGLLGFFIIYLLVQLAQYGNSANCGCFGDGYYMSPLAGIAKNVGMMMGIFLLWKYYPEPRVSQPVLFALPLAIATFTLPFTINRLGQQRLDLSPIGTANSILSQGKHIVCFFSTTCPHCRKAAALTGKQFAVDSTLPYYIVLAGNQDAESDFWEESGAMRVPHTYVADMEAFKKMAGRFVPSIYWIDNSIIVRKTDFLDFETTEAKAWAKH